VSLPAQLLFALALCASLFFGGYFLGKSDGHIDCMAGQAAAQQAGQTAADKESGRRESVGAKREESRERIRVVYRTIREKVDENVKNNPAVNCGLDADGLFLWNAANAGYPATVSGEPDYGLSGAASGQVGRIDGLVPQPRRGDGAVHTVPGSAEETGGVRK
jgi:hypothetical protein